MSYKKFETGELKTDSKGNLLKKTAELKGKIIKVRIDYNTTNPGTTLRISTVEDEEVLELREWFKDILIYPRHGITNEHFVQTALDKAPEVEQFVTVGPLIIQVKDSEPNAEVIKNIIVTYQE